MPSGLLGWSENGQIWGSVFKARAVDLINEVIYNIRRKRESRMRAWSSL